MNIRRSILGLGLGIALAGGVLTAVQVTVHAAGHAPTHAAAIEHPDAAADSDASLPCTTSAVTGEQAGNCADGAQTGDTQDSSGSADNRDLGETSSGANGDSVQSLKASHAGRSGP